MAQPALFAVGVAVWRALAEQGHQLSGAAGLSLGEYTALVAAGAMDFADGLRVVAERGRLMQDAAVARAGGMVAVIGTEDDVVAQLASDAAQGVLRANFNAPGQVVIAEIPKRATERRLWRPSVNALLEALGGRCFHSEHMAPAADGLAKVLESVDLRADDPCGPMLCPAAFVGFQHHSCEFGRSGGSPVRWAESCKNFPAAGTSNSTNRHPGPS